MLLYYNQFPIIDRIKNFIVLQNDQKVSPHTLEGCILGECPFTERIVIFDEGRTHLGALVYPDAQ